MASSGSPAITRAVTSKPASTNVPRAQSSPAALPPGSPFPTVTTWTCSPRNSGLAATISTALRVVALPSKAISARLTGRNSREATSSGRCTERTMRSTSLPRWPRAKSACSPRFPTTNRRTSFSSSSRVSDTPPCRIRTTASAPALAANCWACCSSRRPRSRDNFERSSSSALSCNSRVSCSPSARLPLRSTGAVCSVGSMTWTISSGAPSRVAAQAACRQMLSVEAEASIAARTRPPAWMCGELPGTALITDSSVVAGIAHEAFGTGLVVHAQSADQGRAGLVETHDLHLRAFAAELHDHLVERTYRSQIPEVRAADVDQNAVDGFPEVEAVDEVLAGGEEHLARHGVVACPSRVGRHRSDMQHLPHLAREKQRRQQHPGQHALGEVMRQYRHHDG